MNKENVLNHISRITDERLKAGYRIKSFGGNNEEVHITFEPSKTDPNAEIKRRFDAAGETADFSLLDKDLMGFLRSCHSKMTLNPDVSSLTREALEGCLRSALASKQRCVESYLQSKQALERACELLLEEGIYPCHYGVEMTERCSYCNDEYEHLKACLFERLMNGEI